MSGASILVFARIATLALQLITVPILARALGVEGIGVIAFVNAIIFLGSTLIDLGYNISATRTISNHPQDLQKTADVYVALQSSRLMIAAGFSLFSYLLAKGFTWTPAEEFALSALGIVLFGVALTPVWLYQGQQRFLALALLSVLPRVLCTLLLVIFVNDKNDFPTAIALLYGCEFLIGVIAFYLAGAVTAENMRFQSSVLRREIRAGITAWISILIPTVFSALLPIALRSNAGIEAVGIYSAAEKLLRTATSILWPAAQAIYAKLCQLKDSHKLKAAQNLSLVGILAAAGIMKATIILGADPLVFLVYGKEFSGSASVLQWLSIALVANAASLAAHYFYLFPSGRSLAAAYAVSIVGIPAILASCLATLYFGILGCILSVVLFEVLMAGSLWLTVWRTKAVQ